MTSDRVRVERVRAEIKERIKAKRVSTYAEIFEEPRPGKPRPILLVGESNPYGADPMYALYDEPIDASGYRLRRILGVTRETYLGLGIERVNLCEGQFAIGPARCRATGLAIQARDYQAIVLLGSKVRRAFGLDPVEFFSGCELAGVQFVCLPHPSGRNLIWNQEGQVERARELLRAIAPGLPIGEEP